MTSSPGPMPSAISATSSASVPDDTPIASRHAEVRGQLALERLDLRAEDEALAVADARDRREDLVADRPVLRLEIEQRHRRAGRGGHRTTISGAPQSGRSLRGCPALAGHAGVGVEDEVDLLAGVGRQIDHHRNPAAIGRVGERIDVLREELLERAAVGDAGAEETPLPSLSQASGFRPPRRRATRRRAPGPSR